MLGLAAGEAWRETGAPLLLPPVGGGLFGRLAGGDRAGPWRNQGLGNLSGEWGIYAR